MYFSPLVLVLLGFLWWYSLWSQERAHARYLRQLPQPDEEADNVWEALCAATRAAQQEADAVPNTDTLTRVRICELQQQAAWQMRQAYHSQPRAEHRLLLPRR